MNFDSGKSEVDRRTVLALLAASSASVPVSSGSTVASGESVSEGGDGPADEPGTYLVEQGDAQYEPTALTTGELVEEFYGFGDDGKPRSNTTTGIEKEGVSNLFFWEDEEGVSLVVLNDEPGSSVGGHLRYEFDELPEDGEWVVRDADVIPPEDGNGTFGTTEADWDWTGGNTSGGAYRGGFDGEEPLGVEMRDEGSSEWLSGVEAGPQHAPPAVSGGVACVADWSGSLRAFDASDGTERWRFDTWINERAVAGDDGTIFAVDWEGKGHLYALDAADGSERWRFEFGEFVSLKPPVFSSGTVYATLDRDPYIHALDAADGTEKWSLQVGDWNSLNSRPTISGSSLFIISSRFSNKLHAYDLTDRTELWNTEFDDWQRSSEPPAVADDTVIVSDRTEHLYAFDVEDGTERWQFEADNSLRGKPEVVGDTVLVLDTFNHVLHALDVEDGTERWRFESESNTWNTPTVRDGLAYHTVEDHLYALGVTDGSVEWVYEADGIGGDGITISDGTGYVLNWGDEPGVRAIPLDTTDWHLLSGDAESPDRTPLDPQIPASIHPPGGQECPKDALVPDGEERETIMLENEATRIEIGAGGSTAWQVTEGEDESDDGENDSGDDDGDGGGGGGGPQPEEIESEEDDDDADEDEDDLTDVLFEEYFVLEDLDGNRLRSTEMAIEEGFVPTEVDEHDGGYPGIEYEATLIGDLGEKEIEVTRAVFLDACQPVHDVEYEVTLLSSDAVVDVTLYQYCDYDLDLDEGRPACEGDRGVYEDGIVRVEPAGEDSDGPVVGFREADGEKPDVHHVGKAPAHEVIGDGSLNEAEQYPEEGSGDPVVVQAWELDSLSTMPDIQSSDVDDSDSMTVRFASADSADQLEWFLTVREPPTLQEATEVADVDLPPTAVETDEPVPFRVELETCVDPSLFDGWMEADVTRRGSRVATQEIELEAEPLDEEQNVVEIGAEFDAADELASRPEGVEYEIELEVTVGPDVNVLEIEVTDDEGREESVELTFTEDESVFARDAFVDDEEDAPESYWPLRTYAFRRVDQVGAIAAKPSDSDLETVGQDLFTVFRIRSEFLNEHYASGLGSMGQVGFNVELLNGRREGASAFDPEWEVLDEERANYVSQNNNLPDENTRQFKKDALGRFNPAEGVDIADYDTAMIFNETRLSRPHVMGAPQPAEICFSRFELCIEVPVRGVPAPGGIELEPYELESGELIDGMYETLEADSWSHEFGHALGPGPEIGLPDLYEAPHSFGNIGMYGAMGHGAFNHTFTSCLRGFGGDSAWGRQWIDQDSTFHDFGDEVVTLPTPLSEYESDDQVHVLYSLYAQLEIGFDWDIPELPIDSPWGGDDEEESDTSIIDSPKLGIYLLENRKGELSGIVDPANQELITTAPFSTDGFEAGLSTTDIGQSHFQDGVALYRFDIIEPDDVDALRDEDEEIFMERDSFRLQYLPQVPDGLEGEDQFKNPEEISIRYGPRTLVNYPTKITLSDDETKFEDHETAVEFELTTTRDEGDPEVTVQRGELLNTNEESGTGRIEFRAERADELERYLQQELMSASCRGVEIPRLDVLAKTSDGRRAGTDPETGEIINEIENAKVNMQGRNRTGVAVPATEDVEFTVYDGRLRTKLDEIGIEDPGEIPYHETVIFEDDPTVVERDGLPFIEGRTVRRRPALVGADEHPALVSAEVELDPAQLNARSEGEFVFAWLSFEEVDPDDLAIETVTLDRVPAVSDDQYGFASDPPTSNRGGTPSVRVAFPREKLIETLEEGDHNVTVSGIVEKSTFQGSTELTIRDPGGGRGQGP